MSQAAAEIPYTGVQTTDNPAETPIEDTAPKEEKKPLSKEVAAEYSQKAVKSLMWLSAYMKRWLKEYVVPFSEESPDPNETISLKEIEQRVTDHYPFDQAYKMRTMLTLFNSMLKLNTMSAQPRRQAVLLAKWDETEKEIRATDEGRYFDTYQSLSVNELIDEQEFTGLAREFKHDIDTAGLAVLANEYSLTLWKSIRTAFDSPASRGGEQHAAKVIEKLESNPKISSELIALAVMKTFEVLHSFNLESGGAAYESEEVSLSLDYIRSVVDQAKFQYPFHVVLKDTEVQPGDKKKLTYLNKAALVRFFANGFSNSARVGATEVVVQYELTADRLSVSISDNGKGFPKVTDEKLTRLGNDLQVFEIGLGKTSWDNTKVVGTGTGLAGLKNLLTSIDGELVAGNTIVNGKVTGATTAISAPVMSV